MPIRLAALATWAVLEALVPTGCSSGPTVPDAPETTVLDPSTRENTPDPGTTTASSTPDSATGPADAPSALAEVLFDEVLAIVNADVVTRSQIQESLALEVDTLLRNRSGDGASNRLTPAEIADIERKLVRLRVRDHLLADSVDTLGVDPRRVETIVNRLVDERLAAEEREAGGALQYLERLKERSTTYDSRRDELRSEFRRQIAVSEHLKEARVASQLLVSPRELRQYYDAHKDAFTRKDSADLELLRFPVTTDPKVVQKAKERLAAGATLDAVAKETGADADRVDGIEPGDNTLEALRDFAFAASRSRGDVSEPLERGSSIWLLRLGARTVGGVRPFSDESVQQEMRTKLAQERQNALLEQLFSEEQRRTQFWPPDLYGR
ncbi:MAG: peptidyl-prolyl cis-trans isomerase [Planctomycetes bacterium]|nr:peptidyl-prolyl cis-trans isomerase [Planctomycetota bacterium]